jgi:ribosome assembly protein YihI (activator of Der GTPase)
MSDDPRYHSKKVTRIVAIERVATQSQRTVPKQKRQNEAQAALEAIELNLRKNQEELEAISI